MDNVEAHRIDSTLLDIKCLGHYLYFHGRGVSGKPQILCALFESGGVRTQRELGDRFGIKASSLSEVLAKMEACGYVVRTRDAVDSRKLIVKLTEAGAAEAEAEIARRDRFRAWSLSCLSPTEQEQLQGLLDRVLDHWKQKDWKELDD
ncbi:MarR family winged helix-turn-helix transcriptional regulator [Granulimonas faecalis]|uniref:MarR family winged helix-turn-helix transcriptional regulator n=1 Tax=Granulimonas faecalis TaxID=2894155 RepID=UPI00351786C8